MNITQASSRYQLEITKEVHSREENSWIIPVHWRKASDSRHFALPPDALFYRFGAHPGTVYLKKNQYGSWMTTPGLRTIDEIIHHPG